MTTPHIHLHKGDLPAGLSFPNGVAIDTETLGLNPHRDRLCLVQLSGGDGTAHLVQFDGGQYAAPNLKALLTDRGDAQDLPLRALRHRRAGEVPRRDDGADLLHQDRLQAGAHLHRPPRPEGSRRRTGRHRVVEAAAEFRLGRGDVVEAPARLRGLRRAASASSSRRSSTTCWRAKAAPSLPRRRSASFPPARGSILAASSEIDIFSH